MTTMIEKQIAKATKDVEKYTKAVERHTRFFEKKTNICIKLDCNWTKSEWIEHRESKTYTMEQYGAWFDRSISETNLTEAKRSLEQAERHLEKLTGKAEAKASVEAEANRVNDIESRWISTIQKVYGKTEEERRAEYEAWLKQFKAECKKDGIEIIEADSIRIYGDTPKGERFYLRINDGNTSRSWHCYTLYLDGETIFTSGEFGTAYEYIKKH